jgi:hypothetical protein
VGVPGSVNVAAGATTATFTATTSAVPVVTAVQVTAALNGTVPGTLTVNPPSVTNLSFNLAAVTAGQMSTGTVTLNGPAPAGGATVTLMSGNTLAVTVPGNVVVTAGNTSAMFQATSLATVSTLTTVTITASLNGVSTQGMLTVNPMVAHMVTALSFAPPSVSGGTSSTGTVTISPAAPAGGVAVSLSSPSASVTVPGSIPVQSGMTTATFTAMTSAVSATTPVIVTATLNGIATGTLTVDPTTGGTISEQIIVGGETDSSDFPVTPTSPLFGTSADSGYVASFNLMTTAGVTTTTKPATFSNLIGQGAFGQVRDSFIDPGGNVYACGMTSNQTLPTTAGVVQRSFKGAYHDAFIVKYSPTGTVLALTYIGGGTGPAAPPLTPAQTAETFCYSIFVDASGHVYVSGRTSTRDLLTAINAPAGSFQPTYGGGGNNQPHFGGDFWVAKLNPNMAGPAIWATYVGGLGDDTARGRLAVDAQGNVIVGGASQSTTSFPVPSGQTLPNLSNVSGFGAVVKISADGSKLLYTALFYGHVAAPSAPQVGTTTNAAGGVLLNAAGEAYVCGFSTASDFLTSIGAPLTGFQTIFKGTKASAYVAKLSTTGQLQAITLLGGSGQAGANTEECKGLAFDNAGNVIAMTPTNSADYFTTAGAFQTTLVPGSTSNIAVTKLTPDLSQVVFSTLLGGSGHDEVDAGRVELDANENIWTAFFTTSADLLARNVVTPNAFETAPTGAHCGAILCDMDVAFVKLSADGSKILYGSYLGGSTNSNPRTIRYRKN